MTQKPTYEDLEQIIKQLEQEVLDYVHKEKEFNEERKSIEYSHIRRTISLMKINEELKREIKKRTRADKEELDQVSHRLGERIKEVTCLYDISRFGTDADFSLDAILQALIDFIPPAFQYPEITCARISLDRYEFASKNFENTRWKLEHEITVNNERIGRLEICYLEKKPGLDEGPFLNEAKNLIGAMAESIAKIVEREWAEEGIRKHRNQVEELIRNSSRSITVKADN